MDGIPLNSDPSAELPRSGPYTSTAAAYASNTFKGQLLVTMFINLIINGLWEWWAMSASRPCAHSVGSLARQLCLARAHSHRLPLFPLLTPGSKGWPNITAFDMSTPLHSCLALDMLLTTFMIGTLCSAAGTAGTQQEVKDKKCESLDPQVFEVEVRWRYTPVCIRSLLLRSLALGVYTTALVGLPSFLLLWACAGSGGIPGHAYTIFKTIWAMLVSAFVYYFVFPAAIDKRNFPELEFALQAGSDEAPPLVGNPSFI